MRKSCRCRNIFQNEHVFGQKNRSRTLTFPPIISSPANTSSSKMESAASPLGVSALSSRPRDAGTRAARGERWWAWAGKTIAKGRALALEPRAESRRKCAGARSRLYRRQYSSLGRFAQRDVAVRCRGEPLRGGLRLDFELPHFITAALPRHAAARFLGARRLPIISLPCPL